MALRMTAKEAASLGIVKKHNKPRLDYGKMYPWLPPFRVYQKEGATKIVISGIIQPSLNRWTRMDWREQNETKKDCERTVVLAARKVEQFKHPIVRITYYFGTNARRDKDNYTPKFIMDGLVKAGVIKDDNHKAVDLDWDMKVDRNESRTEIYIREK